MKAAKQQTRLAGHASSYDHGNGVCVSPRCSCGWRGYAAPKTAARAQYQNHVAVAMLRATKTGSQA